MKQIKKTFIHNPSDWIQTTGCHFATSDLEVKCRCRQIWGSDVGSALGTYVTLDESGTSPGLLGLAGLTSLSRGGGENAARHGLP